MKIWKDKQKEKKISKDKQKTGIRIGIRTQVLAFQNFWTYWKKQLIITI